MTREASPPDAILRSGFGSRPGRADHELDAVEPGGPRRRGPGDLDRELSRRACRARRARGRPRARARSPALRRPSVSSRPFDSRSVSSRASSAGAPPRPPPRPRARRAPSRARGGARRARRAHAHSGAPRAGPRRCARRPLAPVLVRAIARAEVAARERRVFEDPRRILDRARDLPELRHGRAHGVELAPDPRELASTGLLRLVDPHVRRPQAPRGSSPRSRGGRARARARRARPALHGRARGALRLELERVAPRPAVARARLEGQEPLRRRAPAPRMTS